MTPEEWRRVKEIFDEVAEKSPAERLAFLMEASGGDATLIEEVESLLRSHDSAGDFIESAAGSALRTGTSIGPYRIVQVIGEGGMGMVYQAVRVDDLYRKLVALKVVRLGVCSPVALRRFETERHILAHLDHPNIAKLLDGGTTSEGQPYFVMDFIAGTPIDEYCEREKLPLRKRLELFLTVCSAVQYAHQNFIVHRDIKPGNIMVTAEGAIRLLDFGIAKLLDPDAPGSAPAPDTTTGYQMMTPEYASPEQLCGGPVTAASDTWALGVLLYLMLTGKKPFEFASRSVHDVYAVIRDTEPRKPSAVALPGRARLLRGDLDNILLMSLRREPERRYTSAEQFAVDIQRYLTGMPVSAREDTFSYRAGKFVNRHKGAVIAAGLAVAALVAGTITTSIEAHEARIERERAERRFNDVRRVTNSLLFDVPEAVRKLPGSAPVRKLLVTRALEFLNNLAEDARTDRTLAKELAAAWERLGDVQAQPEMEGGADAKGALTSYRNALAFREKALGQEPSDTDLKREMISNYGKLSDLLWSTGTANAAVDYARRGLTLSQEVARSADATRQDRMRAAANDLDLGVKTSNAEECRKSLKLFEALVKEDPSDQRLQRLYEAAKARAATSENTPQ
jgi:non-specific serine/threonine protein kinase/serine/threonine-protein kinase